MFVNAADPEIFRVAIVEEGHIEELALESASREPTKANIYKGIVVNIEPSLQASFVNYGGERHGFLPLSEVHPDYYQEKPQSKANTKIQRVLRKGQELIVQVYKEESATKGAYLSTYISLPGRRLVLLPQQTHLGVSRKIEKEEERQRLKELAQKLGLPPEMGLIVRTAGETAKTLELGKDMKYLLKLWETINQNATGQPAPCLLHRDLDLITRTVRDYFSPDITTILVDNAEVFQTLRTFILEMSPRHVHTLKLYKDNLPIFTRFQLEDQIDRIYSERVPLKSGGTIVINPTEALVSIDVNSGRCTSQKEIEDTALKTNLEAADEVARQLRLRDLGGLVVIDFIDMKDRKHQKEVEQALKHSLKKDKARVTVGTLSKFGLLELSRQRLRPTAEVSAYTPCPACQGRGRIKRVDTLSLSLLRQISTQVAQGQILEVRASVPLEVSNFLLNKKRKDILNLEEHYHLKIVVLPKEGLGPEEILVEYIKREPSEAKPGPESKPAAEPQSAPEPQKAAEPQPAPTPKKTGRPRRGSGRSRKKPAPEPGKIEPQPEGAAEAQTLATQPGSEPGPEPDKSAEPQPAPAPKKTGRPRRGSGRSRKKPAPEPGKVAAQPESAPEAKTPEAQPGSEPGPEPDKSAEPQPAPAPKKTGRPRRGLGRSRKKPAPEPGKVEPQPEDAPEAKTPEALPGGEPGPGPDTSDTP
ncbi:MAG: Rne/Rng family ribonuclease [Proteobacteria bacterium]|nr:Rne/Rng family ribonuclease [Pseudomonadota bacterium]